MIEQLSRAAGLALAGVSAAVATTLAVCVRLWARHRKGDLK